jgi:hypothetical protein
MGVLLGFTPGSTTAGERPGLPAAGPWSCPASHPIKGYVTTEGGRRVYFVPAHPYYDEASPERCYASEDEARADGSRPAGGPASPPISGPLAHHQERTVT